MLCGYAASGTGRAPLASAWAIVAYLAWMLRRRLAREAAKTGWAAASSCCEVSTSATGGEGGFDDGAGSELGVVGAEEGR